MDNEFTTFVVYVGLFVFYLVLLIASIIVPREDAEKAEPIAAWDTRPIVIPSQEF